MSRDFILPEYHMVVEGLMPPPSETRHRELREATTNFHDLLDTAVEKVYQAVRFSRADNPRPRGFVSADRYLTAKLSVRWPEGSRHWPAGRRERLQRRVHAAALSLVLDTAKMSHRYWGVDDPSEESYCSYCKRPRPLGVFNQSQFTCDPCFASRGGGT